MPVIEQNRLPRVTAVAASAEAHAEDRLPLGVCWCIWGAVSCSLWSLLAGFVG